MSSQPLADSTVGLIGVGLLGTALAERLIEQGASVQGFDTVNQRREALKELGGVAVSDPIEATRGCSITILSLPTSSIAAAVIEELAGHMAPEQTIVDTTTGDPAEMIANKERLSAARVPYVEALVAGSSVQVRDGEVTLFVGGTDETVDRVTPLLSAVTSRHFHLGAVGNASRFKLVHNLLLGLHRAVLAEGLTFAESLGMEPAEVLRILRETPAASAVMDTKGHRMVAKDYSPQARLSQHLKDVRLILQEAERTHARVSLSKLHASLLEEAEESGFGQLDNSSIIEVFRKPHTD